MSRKKPDGYVFHWPEGNGVIRKMFVMNASKDDAIREAMSSGWTPPRWWQFWRWYMFPRPSNWPNKGMV